jgi:hypothetical protein
MFPFSSPPVQSMDNAASIRTMYFEFATGAYTAEGQKGKIHLLEDSNTEKGEKHRFVAETWSGDSSSDEEWNIGLDPVEDDDEEQEFLLLLSSVVESKQPRTKMPRRHLGRIMARRGSNESLDSLELSDCPRLPNRRGEDTSSTPTVSPPMSLQFHVKKSISNSAA